MGTLSVPLLMSVSEAFCVPFHTLIKLCYAKALEGSSLVLKLNLLLRDHESSTIHLKLLEKEKFPYHRKPSQRLIQWASLESQRVV